MGYHPPLIFGPIAPENNPPIHPEYYKPRVFNITALTNGPTTLLNTEVPHDYVVGQIIRVLISQLYGTYQINEKEGYVLAIPGASQLIVGIDSSNANPFIYNPTSNTTQPQIVAVGDVNTGCINASGRTNNGTFIPGSFIDISPV